MAQLAEAPAITLGYSGGAVPEFHRSSLFVDRPSKSTIDHQHTLRLEKLSAHSTSAKGHGWGDWDLGLLISDLGFGSMFRGRVHAAFPCGLALQLIGRRAAAIASVRCVAVV